MNVSQMPPAAPPAKTEAPVQPAAVPPAAPPAAPAAPKPTPQPAAKPAPPQPAAAKPATGSAALTPLEPPKLRLRHRLLMTSFVAVVALPGLIASLYLMLFAADQYHSRSAFSVRSENFSGALTALSAFTQIGSTSAPESAVLYDYIRSQELMQLIDSEVDLRRMFNESPRDFVFSLGSEPTTEQMLDYWQSMVQVTLDQNTNILTLEVHAFKAEDAIEISQKVIQNSSELINRLSAIAREDTLAAAAVDVAQSQDRLREISRMLRDFREQNSIIDPLQDVASQMGVLGALQTQLATALVEKETILPQITGDNDPRLSVVDRKIAAIRNQIAEERARVREPEGNDQAMSAVIGQFESLRVEEEFARSAYTAAMAAQEQARAEARRQSKYLAVHINPTLSEESLYPRRGLLSALVFLSLFAAWSVMALAYYNMRDRS